MIAMHTLIKISPLNSDFECWSHMVEEEMDSQEDSNDIILDLQ